MFTYFCRADSEKRDRLDDGPGFDFLDMTGTIMGNNVPCPKHESVDLSTGRTGTGDIVENIEDY